MTLLTAAESAEIYADRWAGKARYFRLTGSTEDFDTGEAVDTFEETELTVIQRPLREWPDGRALMTGDVAYTCIAGVDLTVWGRVIHALGADPVEGDEILVRRRRYAIAGWNRENDKLEYRLLCRRLESS